MASPHNHISTAKAENAKFAWHEFLSSIKPYAGWIIIAILLSIGSSAT